MRIVIGLISDTHGLLRPEALDALRDSDFIVHAGDVGDPAILVELARLAPVTAIRGNIDICSWARALPGRNLLKLGEGTLVHVVHDIHDLDLDPVAAGISVVVSGHSHRADIRRHGGVLYVNPGSAGPRRFSLPVSVGRLVVVAGEDVAGEIIAIEPVRRKASDGSMLRSGEPR